ncbi:MAG: hypothetical protein RBS33_09670 [Lentimicrobium sp.]|jgi:hypothetical protein|nr:hypothetical protein [Lentimicrobium sp.]
MDENFGNKKKGISQSNELENKHAVIIYFNHGIELLDEIYELENELRRIIERDILGIYDGHEVALDNSDGSLYMYGPNAELLFKGGLPVLQKTDFLDGAKAYLRFGPIEEGVLEITVDIKTK